MIDDSKRLVHPATTLLVPVVGVVAFDWRLQFVLVFYWLGVGATAARLGVEATFAGRPNSETGQVLLPAFRRLREKRGGIPTPSSLPPVYPHGLPAAIHGAGSALFVWAIACVGVVALADPATLLERRAAVAFGVVGVVGGEAVTFVSNLRRRPYEELSAAAVFGLRHLLAPLAFLLVVVAGAFDEGVLGGAQFPLAVLVLGQTGVDTASEFELSRRLLPARMRRETRIGDRDPIPAGRGEPTATWRVDRRSVVAARALTGPGRVLLTRAGLLVGAIAAFAWLALDGTAGVVAAGGILAAVAVVGALLVAAETDLLYGHLEYRLYDDCVVAYDRLLKTPQWRVDLTDVTETETGAAVLDRVSTLRLQRLALRGREHSATLVGLVDAEGVRERIDAVRFE